MVAKGQIATNQRTSANGREGPIREVDSRKPKAQTLTPRARTFARLASVFAFAG